MRKFSWYDLIVKGLDRSGLHLQEIETPEGMVKRYSRVEDMTAAPDAAVTAPLALPAKKYGLWIAVYGAATIKTGGIHTDLAALRLRTLPAVSNHRFLRLKTSPLPPPSWQC